jgi:hypothetical protein
MPYALCKKQDREMDRQGEIFKLEKKQATIMKQIAEIETRMKGNTMKPEWDTMVRTINNLHTDTALIERKLRNLRTGHPALGYAEHEYCTGKFGRKATIIS